MTYWIQVFAEAEQLQKIEKTYNCTKDRNIQSLGSRLFALCPPGLQQMLQLGQNANFTTCVISMPNLRHQRFYSRLCSRKGYQVESNEKLQLLTLSPKKAKRDT